MDKLKKSVFSIVAIVLAAIMLFCVFGCGDDPVPEPKVEYTVTVVGGDGGGTYEKDSSVTVTASVPEGKLFENWTVGGDVVSADNPYTFAVTEDVTLTANFTDRQLDPLEDEVYYTVVVDGGNIKGTDEIQFKDGEQITVSAKTPEFYEFDYWLKDDGEEPYSQASEFEHTVTDNVKFTAVYSAVSRYNLTLIGCTSESEYRQGREFVTVTANSIENYEFVDWTINGATVTAPSPYEFELTQNSEVTANFKRINISVTASSTNENIAVSITGGDENGLFEEGDTATATAATRNGITVTWRDSDGNVLSTANPYQFEVTDDVAIVANIGTVYNVAVQGGYIGSQPDLSTDIFGGGG